MVPPLFVDTSLRQPQRVASNSSDNGLTRTFLLISESQLTDVVRIVKSARFHHRGFLENLNRSTLPFNVFSFIDSILRFFHGAVKTSCHKIIFNDQFHRPK